MSAKDRTKGYGNLKSIVSREKRDGSSFTGINLLQISPGIK